jgi:hypothetical protein
VVIEERIPDIRRFSNHYLSILEVTPPATIHGVHPNRSKPRIERIFLNVRNSLRKGGLSEGGTPSMSGKSSAPVDVRNSLREGGPAKGEPPSMSGISSLHLFWYMSRSLGLGLGLDLGLDL